MEPTVSLARCASWKAHNARINGLEHIEQGDLLLVYDSSSLFDSTSCSAKPFACLSINFYCLNHLFLAQTPTPWQTASEDKSVKVWSSCGALVGIFGVDEWKVGNRSTWRSQAVKTVDMDASYEMKMKEKREQGCVCFR